MCGNNYNKRVTESEVMKCHHAQGGQRWRTRRTSGIVFALTQKQSDDCKSIAKLTRLQKERQYVRGYICFWRKNRNIGTLAVLADRQRTDIAPNTQGLLYPFEVG